MYRKQNKEKKKKCEDVHKGIQKAKTSHHGANNASLV